MDGGSSPIEAANPKARYGTGEQRENITGPPRISTERAFRQGPKNIPTLTEV